MREKEKNVTHSLHSRRLAVYVRVAKAQCLTFLQKLYEVIHCHTPTPPRFAPLVWSTSHRTSQTFFAGFLRSTHKLTLTGGVRVDNINLPPPPLCQLTGC